MSKAVQFDDYGGVEVLDVREVPRPQPGRDKVLVAVRAGHGRLSVIARSTGMAGDC